MHGFFHYLLPLTITYAVLKLLHLSLSQWINQNKSDTLDADICIRGWSGTRKPDPNAQTRPDPKALTREKSTRSAPNQLTFFVLYTSKITMDKSLVVILAYCAPETSWRRLQRTIWYNVHMFKIPLAQVLCHEQFKALLLYPTKICTKKKTFSCRLS